jgi:exopolysaccharide production protein ExoQ
MLFLKHSFSRLLSGVMDVGLLTLGVYCALAPRGMAAWDLSFAVLALGWLFLQHRLRPSPFPHLNGFILPGFLIAYAGASISWSATLRGVEPVVAATYLSAVAFILIGWLKAETPAESERRQRILLWSLMVGYAVLVFEGLAGQPIHELVHFPRTNLPTSPNTLKRPLALYAMLAWPMALLAKRYWKDWAGPGVIIGMLAISPFLASRSAIAALILGVVVFSVALRFPRLARHGLHAVLMMGLLFAVPIALSFEHLEPMVKDALFHSATERLDIWVYVAHQVQNAPIFGHGVEVMRTMRATPDGPFVALHPHNVFLQIWLELGAVGVLLCLALSRKIIRAIGQLPNPVQPYALGYLATCIVVYSMAFGATQPWFMAGTLLSALLLWDAAQLFKVKLL